MNNLSNEVDRLKSRYREIFLKTSEEFIAKTEKMSVQEFDAFLKEDVSKEICEKRLEIFELRKKFNCIGCAACCNLAVSQFSPEELNQKAKEGDNFAKQFINTFIPYKNEEDANKIYPEYFKLLKTKAQDEKVYFYHCPKVTVYNLCPDYENRPQICKDFPDNPLGFLPKTCGFCEWKEKIEETALKVSALFEIVEFYKSKLKVMEN